MSGTLTIGTNDKADNTGDLIVSFVDSTHPGNLTTDGTRTALPFSGAAPAPAAAVGYNTLTFGPSVQPLGTNLRAFSFFGTVPGNPTQNADGSITITAPSTGFGGDLCTAGFRNGASTWPVFDGIAFGGGCYAEAVMSQTGGNVNPGMSFWLNDIESMNGGSVGDLTGRHWPGQASDYGDWIEVDIAEFDASGDSYGLGNHNWYGTASSTNDVNTGSYGGWVSPVTPATGIDWSKPHRYGWLWVPAAGPPASSVNVLTNSALAGAVVGTPGTVPTGWDISRFDGLSSQVVAISTDGTTGHTMIDLRIFGTTNGTGDVHVFFCSQNGVAVSPSTVFTGTVKLAVVAGTDPGGTYIDADNLDSGHNYISSNFQSVTLTNTLTDYTVGFTTTSSTAFENFQLGFFGPTSGTSVDVTYRIEFPQLFFTPAGDPNRGYQKFFFDGQQVGTTLFWNQWTSSETPPPVQGSTAYNVLDTRHVAFIFGCGSAARPVTVYSLSVWQKDISQNIGTASTVTGSATSGGTYLVAPSISPQPGCVVTQSPAFTAAQWESCSLIWQPPPHAATLWTSGGAFAGSGGAAANPKFPPQSFSGAGETDATASVSGRIAALDALGAAVGASAGISGRLRIRALSGATLAGAGGIKGVATGPGATLWQEAAIVNGSGSISARLRLGVAAGGLYAGSASISGNATLSSQQYAIAGEIDGSGGISSSAWVGHQYFVSGKPAGSAAITFSPTTPLRVTNWVRNPRPEGVTAGFVDGTSNTGPTDWWLLFANPDSMLAVTMIGTGTEGIIPYVDIRWNNASCPGGFQTVQTDGGIPVSSGVVWSYSVFCRLVGGSLTNISSIGLQILTDGTTGFFNGPTITPTSASLASQWSHWDGVNVTDTGMTNISAGLVINANAGAVDLTLRIGAPKAEKASAASGSQFQAIPQIGFVPSSGGSSSFVY